MKKTCFILLFLVFSGKVICQLHRPAKWTVFTQFAIQESDKRLYDYPGKKRLLSEQPERFGTYQFNLGIKRNFYPMKRLEFRAGLGIGMERATFDRPYNQFYYETYAYRESYSYKSYGHMLLLFPFEAGIKLFKKGGIYTQLLPQITIHNMVKAPRPEDNYAWKIDPGFYSAELNAGIYYVLFKRLELSANCRLWQEKIVDKVLFNNAIYPKADFSDRLERYNLLKFTMGAGVKF